MVSGISGGSMPMVRQMPPPNPQEKFAELDADGNGNLGIEELEVMAAEISEMTGENVSAEDLLSKLDSDGNGTLEMGEMKKPEGPPKGPPPMDGQGPQSFFNTSDSLAQHAQYGEEEDTTDVLLEMLA